MKKIYNYYYWKQLLFIKCYMTIVFLKNGILIIFESPEKVWLVYTVMQFTEFMLHQCKVTE